VSVHELLEAVLATQCTFVGLSPIPTAQLPVVDETVFDNGVNIPPTKALPPFPHYHYLHIVVYCSFSLRQLMRSDVASSHHGSVVLTI